MKYIISLICLAAGIGIGWYFGYTRPVAKYQRDLLEKYQPIKNQLEAQMAYFQEHEAEHFKAAAPWEASSASIALSALKYLDTNNIESARSRLAAIVAIYYRGHSRDGDTNLLASIAAFASTDSTLSNAISVKSP